MSKTMWTVAFLTASSAAMFALGNVLFGAVLLGLAGLHGVRLGTEQDE